MQSLSFLTLAIACLGLCIYHFFFRKTSNLKLPPGPRPLPLIGNVLDLPPPGKPHYLHWLKHKDKYGPLSSVTVLGQTMIIIHDRQVAYDLMEKNSLKTSGRPISPFASEYCGYGSYLPILQYGEQFRNYRKMIHHLLGTKVHAAQFNHINDVESRRLLLRILDDPDNLRNHIKTEAAAIILSITYGYSVEPHVEDPLCILVEQMADNVTSAFVPFVWLIDVFPALKYFPEGLPLTRFKTTGRQWKKVTETVIDAPYRFVQEQMAIGSYRPSYVSSLLEDYNDDKVDGLDRDFEEAIKQTASILYIGGADTTVSNISSFILAMILFPNVQEKAQKEIDTVVGTGRLPNYGDREKLPYVNAVIAESLRWLPITPISVPHAVDEEFIYNGYRIPKGAYLIPSIWWFLHNPDVYSEPSSFDPERYLEPRKEPEPSGHFGFGRRTCPGRFLAMESLFITICHILAAFKISKAVDEEGKEIEPKVEPLPGLVSHPAPFSYSIKPRSLGHVDLIRAVEVDNPWAKSDAVLLEGDLIKELVETQAKKASIVEH